MSNFKLAKFQYSFLETTTSGGTLNLPADCEYFQIFLGSLSHTAVLPNATLVAPGESLFIVNKSTGSISVQNFGGSVIGSVGAGSVAEFFLSANGSANGTWVTYSSGATGQSGIWGSSPGASKASAPRGVFGGGTTGSDVNTIDYINISSPGNAQNFGNLTLTRNSTTGVSSSTRGIFAGGSASATQTAVADFITFAVLSNASAFGSLNGSGRFAAAGAGNELRGIIAGGNNGADTNDIQYYTIANNSASDSFGNLTSSKSDMAGLASPVRGIFTGGTGLTTAMDFVTIAARANATSFSTMNAGRQQHAACANLTIGVIAGGNGPLATVEYITPATQAVGQPFGTLTQARRYFNGASSRTRACFGGGLPGAVSAVIDTLTFASGGLATNFGNLSITRYTAGACSSAHGGLL